MAYPRQKRLLIIQDISCIGRCSLTVALPVLSCLGVQAIPLPTALLSAHTAFKDVYRRDMLEDMQGIAEAWKGMSLHFDAIYVGYLGGAHQMPLVKEIVARYKQPDTLLFVDPVMGDHGKKYSFVTQDMVEGFRALCQRAEVIFPNHTEAALLLGVESQEGVGEENLLTSLITSLSPAAVLTGAEKGEELGALALDQQGFHAAYAKRHPGAYPGTGDLLASACIGALLRGLPLQQALECAVSFVSDCIGLKDLAEDSRLGVPFEGLLPALAQRVQQLLTEGEPNHHA